MDKEKIEPRLLEEIRRVETAGQPDRKIPVIIEHVRQIGGIGEEGKRIDYNALEQRVRGEQEDIRKRLFELGVTDDVQQMSLANALEVRLTPAQIKEIAAHSDVKLIVLNREEQVTA